MQRCEIFISYREEDSGDWPARLSDEFARVFGPGRTFFARRSIDTGRAWQPELEQALEHCRVMLVLIGPAWAGCRPDGHRRLDDADDWVRREVTEALKRQVAIRPVLLAERSQPREVDLPEAMRPLAALQSCRLWADPWPEGLLQLTLAVARDVPFDAFAVATREARELLHRPAALRLTGRSAADWRGRVGAIDEQIGRIVARKQVHDHLHALEKDLLRPLQAGASASLLEEGRLILEDVRRGIEADLPASALDHSVNVGLTARLDRAARAMAAALTEPIAPRMAALEAALRQTLSGSLTTVNHALVMAAKELKLDELADFRPGGEEGSPVVSAPAQPSGGTELVPLRVALKWIRHELQWRVSEHNVLQSFDDELRKMCEAGEAGAASEWFVVQAVLQSVDDAATQEMALLREALTGRRCPYLAEMLPRLRALDRLVSAPGTTAAAVAEALRGTFYLAARSFNSADRELKEWCVFLDKLRGHLADLSSLAGESP